MVEAPWPTFGAKPGCDRVDFAAACGVRGSADMSVFLPQDRVQQKKCFLQFSEVIDRVDIENWTQQLTDDQWEQVRDTLLKEFGVVIDNVLQF